MLSTVIAAVIVAVPSPIPVITPLATVATSSSLELQVIVASAGTVVAVKVFVPLTKMDSSALPRVILGCHFFRVVRYV